jgi:hypothetical protein
VFYRDHLAMTCSVRLGGGPWASCSVPRIPVRIRVR